MSELKAMLKQQAKLHAKQGANGLADLFNNAESRIEQLEKENAELKAGNLKLNEIINYITGIHPKSDALAQHIKEVASKAVNDVANEMNEIYTRDYQNKHIPSGQWYWWNRAYGFMKDKVKQLQEQE